MITRFKINHYHEIGGNYINLLITQQMEENREGVLFQIGELNEFK